MITIKRTFNPSGLLQVDDLRGEVFTGESGAHIFEISGVGVQLAGTVKGTFLAPNGVTIPLDGSAADGVVSMTLTEDCYVAPGRFILSIFLSSGSVTGCIYCGVGNVFRTQSDVISYPSASIPDIEQIIANAQAAAAQIQAEVTAAQAAVAAAQTAVDGIEDQRQTMIESIASVAGQGTDTTLTQSGVAADAKAAGDHISDLKSAINNVLDVSTLGWEIGSLNSGSGTEQTSSTRIRSDYIPVTKGIKVTVTGNPNCLIVYCFNESKGWISDTTWSSINNAFTVPSGVAYIRILIRVSVSNETIAASDVETQYRRCSVSLVLPQRVYTIAPEVDKTNDAIEELSNITTETVTKTESPTLEWTDGAYLDAYGTVNANSSYAYTDFIPVNGGDILNGYMRFCTAYNSTKSALSSYFVNNVNTYTVNPAVSYVRISREKLYKSSSLTKSWNVVQNSALSHIDGIETVCNGTDGVRKTGDISDSTLEFNAFALIRKGKTIGFYGKVSAFNKLTIGCGTTDVNSSHIEIDTTNVKFYNASTVIYTAQHNLVFTNYIYVAIEIDGNAYPTIVINTDGGNYKETVNDEWIGALTRIYATADADTSLTDCILTFSAADVKKNIWYCGDSYMAVRDGSKIPSKLKYIGVFDHINSMGYSGAGAENVMPSINKLFGMEKYPKYLVWALGMNNGDTSSAVNANWKSSYDKLIALAENGSFELILATIPNTPTINNNYKNAIVRESGFRYIDFADAVQTAEGESTWITGMLSNDNVHPTTEGAKALASRLCADFPEIFN